MGAGPTVLQIDASSSRPILTGSEKATHSQSLECLLRPLTFQRFGPLAAMIWQSGAHIVAVQEVGTEKALRAFVDQLNKQDLLGERCTMMAGCVAA